MACPAAVCSLTGGAFATGGSVGRRRFYCCCFCACHCHTVTRECYRSTDPPLAVRMSVLWRAIYSAVCRDPRGPAVRKQATQLCAWAQSRRNPVISLGCLPNARPSLMFIHRRPESRVRPSRTIIKVSSDGSLMPQALFLKSLGIPSCACAYRESNNGAEPLISCESSIYAWHLHLLSIPRIEKGMARLPRVSVAPLKPLKVRLPSGLSAIPELG